MDSPFFDQEQFYTPSTLSKLKEMFPTKQAHITTLLKLYKFLFPQPMKKTIWEKSQNELLDEISSTPLSLNMENIIAEHTAEINQILLEDKLLTKKISLIGVFIDCAYLYYVWHFDPEAPIHKLPTGIMKFKLISDAIGAPSDDLSECFIRCMTDSFIKETRIEQPPYMLRTELTSAEIREKLHQTVKPIFKNILDEIFKLEDKKVTVTHLST